jgi:hypothetical protein
MLKFVQGSPEFTPEEDWGRSVILFNTWGDEPPLDVPEATESESSSNDDAPTSSNPIKSWNEVRVYSDQSNDDDWKRVPAKVWLLGDYRRRDHQLQTVKLEADERILRQALHEETTVRSVKLFQP